MDWMEFSEWITQKFIEWRGSTVGHAGSVAEYARLFGATQSLMSQWMQRGGKTPNSYKYLNALSAMYGKEVYEVLGLQAPETVYDSLPGDFRSRLEAAARELEAELQRRRLTGNEPEALPIAIEIFERHGFKYTANTME